MSKKTGGPAFPVPAEFFDQGFQQTMEPQEGMTLRDWFASKAPEVPADFWHDQWPDQDSRFPKHSDKKWCEECKCGSDCTTPEVCGELKKIAAGQKDFRVLFNLERTTAWNYKYADAMIAERDK